ncbi:hypothetical protein ACFQ06_14990, partial [Tessaracoccus lubricantis]
MPRGNDDLNWLYRDEEPESTSVLRPDEIEKLRRADARRDARKGGVPQATTRPQPAGQSVPPS